MTVYVIAFNTNPQKWLGKNGKKTSINSDIKIFFSKSEASSHARKLKNVTVEAVEVQ